MDRHVSIPWSAFFGSLFVILTAVGLMGNIIVIIAISGDKKMRSSVMNMLLLNLAIADALNLITTTVEWVPIITLGYTAWIFPNFLCPVARYFECVFLFTSILTQLIVCVERYIAIVYPIHARRLCSRNNILIAISVTWLFVLLFAAPYAHLHVVKTRKNSDSHICVNYAHASVYWQTYKKIEFFALYVIPCIVFVVLYSKISCVLWAKNRELYEEHSRFEALNMRRNVVKMLVACVCVYFICYSPIQGIFLSKWLFSVDIYLPYEFRLLMNALALTCSACNPLLYTLFSRKFRVRIATILMCSKTGTRSCNEYTNSFYKIFVGVRPREAQGSHQKASTNEQAPLIHNSRKMTIISTTITTST